MNTQFGELKKALVREHWPNEEYDFTPWLAKPENIAQLADAVGLELEVDTVEKECGPYFADILAKESGSDKYVIIENQFGKTNHDHLGKLLTYAAVLNAGTVIWIGESFTDEHQKTMEWLNDHTTEDVSFYGVELELWQIDGSRPAVRFNVVSRPNDAVRTATALKGELSDTRKMQLEFWTAFSEKLIAEKVLASTQKPRPQYWFEISLGRAGIFLSNIANTYENRIGIRLYMNNRVADAALAQLVEQRPAIESELGQRLLWNPNPDARDKVISLLREADLTDRDRWPEYLDWLIDKVRRYREVFGPRVKRLDLSRQQEKEALELANGE
jgi:hypothetical protein